MKRTHHARNRKHDIGAMLLFGVAIVSIGTFFYLFSAAKSDQMSIDEHNCKAKNIPEIIAVVIDYTDSINAIQKASLEKYLQDIAYTMSKNGKLKFYSVQDMNNGTLDAELEVCNPGNEDGVSEWTGNKKLARKKYEEQFTSQIEKQLNMLLTAKTANSSPIMRSLQSVYVTNMKGHDVEHSKKKLILVSDLLEHTDAFSMYNGVPDFNAFEKTAYWSQVKADMNNTDVELLFLNRASAYKLQTPDLKLFWQYYFLNQGANSVKFLPIEG